MLRIALIQQRCEKAAPGANLDALCACLEAAAARKVDIAAFPEMNLTGYADPTRYPGAIRRLGGPEVAAFLRRSAFFPGTVLAGLIEENPGGKPFITQAAARRGEQATRNWQRGFAWWEDECRQYLGKYARQYGVWIAAATQAGRTVDEDFPGGGYLFDPQGRRVFATPDWSPGAVYLEINLENGSAREI